jgi:hypothetical protein
MAQINSITIPTSFDTKGVYVAKPPEIVGVDGEGIPIQAGYSSVTWTFDLLSATDYAWWVTTLLAGAPGARFTTAQLYNHLNTLTTYTNIVVKRPTFGGVVHSTLYQDVVVEISQLI